MDDYWESYHGIKPGMSFEKNLIILLNYLFTLYTTKYNFTTKYHKIKRLGDQNVFELLGWGDGGGLIITPYPVFNNLLISINKSFIMLLNISLIND